MANVKISELPALGAAPATDDRIVIYDLSTTTDKTMTVAEAFTSPGVTTSLTTPSTTFALVNTTATTVNAFGATTTLNIGASATCILNFGGSTTASEFRFLEPSGSGTNYTAFKAQAQGASITYTLPATVGGAGTVLTDSAGNGTLSWAAAGAGTVTVVGAGSLTSTALVTGGGTTTLQTPSATATMDTSGNIATPGSLSTGVGGSVAGNIALTQGSAPSAGTTNITIYAPASVTSYVQVLPGAAATGFYLGTNSSGTVTVSQVASTGSGSVVLGTSPTIATPAISAPTITYTVEPGSDDTGSGQYLAGLLAGDTTAQWDLLYLDSSSGRWELADADAVATAGAVLVGLGTAAGTDGNALTVQLDGIIRNDGWTWSAAGKPLYASGTPGGLTETIPVGTDDVERIIAYSLSDDCIWLCPSQYYQTHV